MPELNQPDQKLEQFRLLPSQDEETYHALTGWLYSQEWHERFENWLAESKPSPTSEALVADAMGLFPVPESIVGFHYLHLNRPRK